MSSSNDDDDDVKFPPVTDIDPNVWYHLTEFRVDTYGKSFTSNFHIDGDGELRVFGILKKQTWQFHPVNATIGRYSLRHNFMGVYKQLAVCYDPTEASVGKTKPCLLDSVPGEQAQMWDVADWGDGMVRLINVGNGTKYWLDVHQGNPPFMSSSTDTSDDNPAQRWLYTSVSDVNDAAYSTVFSAEGSKPSTPRPSKSSSTQSSPTSERTGQGNSSSNNNNSPDSDTSGLSAGATAGIGAGAGLAIVALSLLIFWLCRRQRRGKKLPSEPPSTSNGHMPPEKLAAPPAWSHEQQQQQQQQSVQQGGASPYDPYQHPLQHPQQLSGIQRPQEMSTDPRPQEMASVRY
ncbi:hypothetical protein NLU13_2586 [Sarocladium strictum]|uniref:Uncharacterized protein n=1 Tax=Sarocladium strictum TaxID=5046 RepID=A0AA39GLA4_SARSR|nr:hypothetical protein NLU13_2586 [Sarocladium strictum]